MQLPHNGRLGVSSEGAAASAEEDVDTEAMSPVAMKRNRERFSGWGGQMEGYTMSKT